MNNLSAYDTPNVNEWFDEHPQWTRHFTPQHASWLNQIEFWFSIFGGSFWREGPSRAFKWSYRPKSLAASAQLLPGGTRPVFQK